MENRSEFINGRTKSSVSLSKMVPESLDYRLIKELWAYTGNRIAVRFAYEFARRFGSLVSVYGNENGSSMTMASWLHGLRHQRPSISNQIANITGYLGRAPRTPRVKRILALVLLSFISMRVSIVKIRDRDHSSSEAELGPLSKREALVRSPS